MKTIKRFLRKPLHLLSGKAIRPFVAGTLHQFSGIPFDETLGRFELQGL